MAQLSGFWTTGGSTGHQQVSYTQAQLGSAYKILAACSGFQGVAPGFLNKLAGTVPGVNSVSINTGGAMVDGRWYYNDSAANVSIPSAVGSGNTRIDRIVLRMNASGFIVQITRIPGTDAVSPTAPAITQVSGSTYDIQLYQALVNTSGQVTLTDERVWALVAVDGSTIEHGSGALRIMDDGVTNAKLADPYDVAIIKVLDPDEALAIQDGLFTLPVPDTWDTKKVVRLWAKLTGAVSTSGNATIRIYNATKTNTIGTITITQGNAIGFTTSITNATVNVDDVIRVDVTGPGTGSMGLDVQIKVDKS